jgi:large repetitive protein
MRTVKLAVRSMLFHLGLACLVLLLAAESRAAVFYVDKTDDTLPWPGMHDTSLRAVLLDANNNSESDTIILPEGTYTLTIAGSDDANRSGDLDILDSVIIIGAGPDKTIIDGNAIDRVFDIWGLTTTVIIHNLTIQNGRTTFSGGAGINNRGKLILSNVVIKDNSVIKNSYQPDYSTGGGVYNSGSLEIYNSTISGNRAVRGGGLFTAKATIKQSLFTGNKAMHGSAIQQYGTLQLVNTSIHGNGFDNFDGGRCALAVNETATVSFCTITDNLTFDLSQSSGLCVSSTGQLTLHGTILAGNKRMGTNTNNNCYLETPPTSATYNLEDADTCGFSTATNLINTDPRLGALQNNGGPTLTRALLDGSLAIDYVTVNTGVTVDQRGFNRPVGSWADIGAYEYIPPTPICFPVKSPDGKTAVICL